MCGCVGGSMCGGVDVWVCGCVDGCMCGCVDVWVCGCVDVRMCVCNARGVMCAVCVMLLMF